MKPRTVEDVDLWRKAHARVLAIYTFTQIPNHELFGLTSQLRRWSVGPRKLCRGFQEARSGR